MSLVIYTAMAIPLQIGTQYTRRLTDLNRIDSNVYFFFCVGFDLRPETAMVWITTIVFILDVFVSFRTAYYDQSRQLVSQVRCTHQLVLILHLSLSLS